MDRQSDKFMMAVMLGCLLLLSILAVTNYTKDDPMFRLGGDRYYVGRNIPENDPRNDYGLVSQGSTSSSYGECSEKIPLLDVTQYLTPYGQSLPWIQSSAAMTLDEVENNYGKHSEFTPFKDGDYIVAPGNIVFTTSNTSFGMGNMIIEYTIGTQWKVSLVDVKSWFCHMDADEKCQHTKVCGKGSYLDVTSKASVGAVLGRAKASTIVYIYHKVDGEWVPSTFKEYYNS